MPSEIKFSSFGIPRLAEFANVTIRSPAMMFKKSKGKGKATKFAPLPDLPPPPLPVPVRCNTCGHITDHHAGSVAQSDTLKVPSASPGPRPGGLYIRFDGQAVDAAQSKISERRLLKLRWTIAEAVTKVGMSTPASETGDPLDSQSTDGTETVRSMDSTKQALFKGTYGQVKEALKNAGLTTTPCAEGGFEHATRLGALFVVNSKTPGVHGLEFTKLTLWG